jgi:hypothetical protein
MSQQSYDALGHWAEASASQGSQLVRVLSCQQANRYTAAPIGFASDGSTQLLNAPNLTVTNLSEPATGTGTIAPNTDALAIDAGGRWVIFVRNAVAASGVAFAGKVISALGGAGYTVREQVFSAGGYHDKSGVADVQADNLAEMSLGSGAAVDAGTIALVLGSLDGDTPPTLHYVFDHPLYAKYMG